jgi:GAF domain-containing protein
MVEKIQSAKGKSTPEQIIRKLSILVEINQAVSRNLNLEDSLTAALQILAGSYNIKSGAVFLFNEDSNSLHMAVSIGYKKELAKDR